MSISSNTVCLPNNNAPEARETQSRKRKRDGAHKTLLDERPFTVKPSSSDLYEKPQTFTPLCLLSRAQIPLAYLDTTATGPRLFRAHIQLLEDNHGEEEYPDILITKNHGARALYAIERVHGHTYAACKLGGWVTEQELLEAATMQIRQDAVSNKRRALQVTSGNGVPWWSSAAVEGSVDTCMDAHTANQLGVRMLRPAATPNPLQETAQNPPPEACPVLGVTSLEDSAALASPQDVLQELAKSYLEALYTTRTSLAYFSKGPLPRARAAFITEERENFNVVDLIDFLRGAVVHSTTMDKKFRGCLFDSIKELPPPGLGTSQQAEKIRKSRKWKGKRDKRGFFSDEKEYVRNWWWSDMDSEGLLSSAEAVESAFKRRMPRLRGRETYLQVILVLEVLALEASMPVAHGEPQDEGFRRARENKVEGIEGAESQAVDGSNAPQSKKPKDMVAVLESLLDRLCIWNSLESHSPSKKSSENDGNHQQRGHDELKDFCIEVIVPFYLSRVPNHAATVNRKLGGPVAPSPEKRKTVSRKPGQLTARPLPEKKQRGPLQRVSSNTIRTTVTRPVPSLQRSATDSQVEPLVKRERSDSPSLFSIPPVPVQIQRKRPSFMQTLAKRQVDLSAVSQANDVKMRKKAEVEEKLREAISTLKKPNRNAAVKEVASAADASFAQAVERKRPGQPLRRERPHTAPLSVDREACVTATPSHRRTVQATPSNRIYQEQHRHGPSITNRIASSGTRTGAHQFVPSTAVPATGHRPRRPTVEDTPSQSHLRPSQVHLPAPQFMSVSPEIDQRSRLVDATPSKPASALRMLETPGPVWSMARARSVPGDMPASIPSGERLVDVKQEFLVPQRSEANEQRSIYDAMGWNDDYDD